MAKNSMNLEEFFEENPQFNKTTFSKKVGIDRTSIHHYMNWERTPTLLIALKMHYISGGQLDLTKLLNPTEIQSFKECQDRFQGIDAL